jgi:hypothetical protein
MQSSSDLQSCSGPIVRHSLRKAVHCVGGGGTIVRQLGLGRERVLLLHSDDADDGEQATDKLLT